MRLHFGMILIGTGGLSGMPDKPPFLIVAQTDLNRMFLCPVRMPLAEFPSLIPVDSMLSVSLVSMIKGGSGDGFHSRPGRACPLKTQAWQAGFFQLYFMCHAIWVIQSIHANIFSDYPSFGSRPYGQPGQLPKGNFGLPLLIELKAQFYKLVTL